MFTKQLKKNNDYFLLIIWTTVLNKNYYAKQVSSLMWSIET